MWKIIATAVIAIMVTFALTLSAEAAAWQDHSPDQEPDKTWIVTFNKPVDKATVTTKTIYITDSNNEKQTNPITYSDSDKKIHMAPPAGNYRNRETYTLHITQALRNNEGTELKEPVTKTFSIKKSPTYDVATVQANGTTTVAASYPSFEAAASQMRAGQAVLFQNEIIHMPAGLVSTVASGGSSLTILYNNAALTSQETYVPAHTELVYVDSTAAYVEIELAGRNFYIKPQNAKLLPMQTVTDRTHYKVMNNSLYHLIYSHHTKKYGSYEMGAAPSFMQEGVKYYSTDGSHFYNETGALIGTAHQYFQHLPMRSMTRYTAQELDAYIMMQLGQLERSNPDSATYKHATTRSKLIGLGSELKRIERESHVNAMHILALAQHESQYGLSKYALESNNLFGMYVTDDNPSNKHFDSISANIQELVNAFLNRNYLPPLAKYANGTNFGNKAIGMNVKYASDPYWGSKIAGHLYRMDRLMGGREMADQLKIGLTNEVNLNVRVAPYRESLKIYHYPKVGMPLIIQDDQLPESPWIKMRSDKAPYDSLYVHGDYVGRLEWQ
ncbi:MULTISPECIES: glucosaminidase domain-containing protein [unclassified Sporosarcina]|uniref:glucosaminidase domain-containing protein n=1 Tax=unclassified Sporosarcina TaxID=2647733 RepID=UPI001E615B10|nr:MULTISPECIES: glucosaminidase domain-containing protein [unclassified Sporosarcina]